MLEVREDITVHYSYVHKDFDGKREIYYGFMKVLAKPSTSEFDIALAAHRAHPSKVGFEITKISRATTPRLIEF